MKTNGKNGSPEQAAEELNKRAKDYTEAEVVDAVNDENDGKKSPYLKLKARFFEGLLLLGPIALVGFCLTYIYTWLVGSLRPVFKPIFDALHADAHVPHAILPFFGVLLTLFGVLLLGEFWCFLVRRKRADVKEKMKNQERWDGKVNSFLRKIPVVGSVACAVRTVLKMFSPESTEKLPVVLVPFPSQNSRSIAFVMDENKIEDREYCSVYMPTAPNPASGCLLFMPKDDASELDIPVGEAVRMIMTVGAASPQEKNPKGSNPEKTDASKKRSPYINLMARFFDGLLLLGPIALCAFFLKLIYSWSIAFLRPVFKPVFDALHADVYVPHAILPLCGVVLTLFVLLLLGEFLCFLRQRVLEHIREEMKNQGEWDGKVEDFLEKIPVVGSVACAIRSVLKMFSPEDEKPVSVVSIPFPAQSSRAIAFAMGRNIERCGRKCREVYMPTTPDPSSGYFLYVPEEDVIELGIEKKEAVELIMSFGRQQPFDSEKDAALQTSLRNDFYSKLVGVKR